MFLEGITSMLNNPLWLMIHIVVIVALIVAFVMLAKKR